jgi:hypothetical protein
LTHGQGAWTIEANLRPCYGGVINHSVYGQRKYTWREQKDLYNKMSKTKTMKKLSFAFIFFSTTLLSSQLAYASMPYQGGIETVIPFALSENHLAIPLLLGFLTSSVIFAFSSSARANTGKWKFIQVLFADFWFEGFVTPGIGTFLLFASYTFFLMVVYFLIWSASSGYISTGTFCISLLLDVLVFVFMRVGIESMISLSKITESANAILNHLKQELEAQKLPLEIPPAQLDAAKVQIIEHD